MRKEMRPYLRSLRGGEGSGGKNISTARCPMQLIIKLTLIYDEPAYTAEIWLWKSGSDNSIQVIWVTGVVMDSR